MAINTANLAAFYNLEDLSDSSGNSRTLTNNNTATFTSGKILNAGTFVRASSQWLSRSYDSGLNIGGGDFTVACWVKKASTNFQHCVGMGWDEPGNLLFELGIRGDNNFAIFEWYNGGYLNISNSSVALSNGTWYFLCVRRSGTTISLSVNNGTPTTTSGTLGTTTAGDFGIARGGAGAAAYFDGQIDAVGIWKGYSLSDAEVTELYNGGAGQQYPFAGGGNTSNFFNYIM